VSAARPLFPHNGQLIAKRHTTYMRDIENQCNPYIVNCLCQPPRQTCLSGAGTYTALGSTVPSASPPGPSSADTKVASALDSREVVFALSSGRPSVTSARAILRAI
jgi:hypothetical protein